ncbi:MAG: Asp23/Gls24 family envelope stress response protein, partial [Candidatus Promineifilaceae bacterium]
CYGVVGMANKGLVDGLSNLLSRDSRRGIEVVIEDDHIVVDVYVIVQYGTRIRAVAESIQNTVKFHVERAIGVPVSAVNVYVQGLRLSEAKA